jgi:hypothetical protein
MTTGGIFHWFCKSQGHTHIRGFENSLSGKAQRMGIWNYGPKADHLDRPLPPTARCYGLRSNCPQLPGSPPGSLSVLAPPSMYSGNSWPLGTILDTTPGLRVYAMHMAAFISRDVCFVPTKGIATPSRRELAWYPQLGHSVYQEQLYNLTEHQLKPGYLVTRTEQDKTRPFHTWTQRQAKRRTLSTNHKNDQTSPHSNPGQTF